jgi:hypothetical protein
MQMTLENTKETLAKTEVTLSKTKEDLELHCMVLEEHKETEEKFHSQAGKTVETLEEALRDVEGLHSKIGIVKFTPKIYSLFLYIVYSIEDLFCFDYHFHN